MGTITGRAYRMPHFIEIEKAEHMTSEEIRKEAHKAAVSPHNNPIISESQAEKQIAKSLFDGGNITPHFAVVSGEKPKLVHFIGTDSYVYEKSLGLRFTEIDDPEPTIPMSKVQKAKLMKWCNLIVKSHQGLVPKKVEVTKKGKTFTQTFWVSPEGSNHDEKVREIAKERGLYIAPAWHSLQINKDPKAGCQVKGINVKGDAVYVRTKAYNDENAAAKFARLKALEAQYPKLEQHLKKNLSTSEEAKVLYLITKTGFRVDSGKDTKANVKAYGASTLRSEHVKVSGSKVSFDFIGKDGVHQEHEITDSKIAGMIKGKTGALFDTNYNKVKSYLKGVVGDKFKVKDIRTYVATDTAIKHANTLSRPENEKQFKSFIKEVCTVVSKKLGNTPAMARSAYIDPAVWDEFKKGWL